VVTPMGRAFASPCSLDVALATSPPPRLRPTLHLFSRKPAASKRPASVVVVDLHDLIEYFTMGPPSRYLGG
jgi:hypothetical protein